MKIKQFAAVVALIAVALVFAVLSDGSKIQADLDTVTVAVASGEGYRVVSQNPVTVTRGQFATFDIEIDDGYVFRKADMGEFADGKLTVNDVFRSKTVYLDLGKYCSVTVDSSANGKAELISYGTVLDGESASVRITPDENYVIKSISVNGKAYPIPATDTLSFTVADDSLVSVEFAGKSVTFMTMYGNLGTAFVENETDDYRYGDVLKMNCDYDSSMILFGGWSVGGYLSDGGELLSKSSAFEYTITENTILYANFTDRSTFNVKYNPNFGTQIKNIDGEYSPGEYINLAVDNGAFVRDGYSLVAFNTKSDGSGTRYSLGAMLEMPRHDVTLYAEWVKESDPSYFDCTVLDGGVVINGLNAAGKAADLTKLTLPKYIDEVPVISVSAGAFTDMTALERVIIPVGIKTLGSGAFAGCTALTTVFFPETMTYIADDAFDNTPNFTNMRVIACLDRAFDYDYDSAMADKYMRLLNTEGKRIILVGGSNLSFGLDSSMIKAQYPDYTVINFSCSAFYGILPLFDMLEKHVRADDIVIFAPEYYSTMYAYTEESTMNNWQYIESNYDILSDINIKTNSYVFRTFTDYLAEKRAYLPGKKVNADNVYIRSGFNREGDLTVYRKNKGTFGFYCPDGWIITDRGMDRYNTLCTTLSQRGATCLFSFPPLPNGGGSKDYIAGQTAAFEAKLRGMLNTDKCTVISSMADYYFDDVLFYDNVYHLTLDGAKVRTEQLLEDLAAYFAE